MSAAIIKVVNISATTQLKVVLVKPERFEPPPRSPTIAGEAYRGQNLEQTSKDVARRLIDFSRALPTPGRKIKKVANSTFLITPFNVDLMGDLLDELESSGMYFYKPRLPAFSSWTDIENDGPGPQTKRKG
jgi:cell division inhibitor SepF